LIKPETVIHEIQADIESIEKNANLYGERNFESRLEALNELEFNVIDRIDGLLQKVNLEKELTALKQHALQVKRRLEEIDDDLFQRIRTGIRMGGCTGATFKSLIAEYVACHANDSRQQDEPDYDNLDMFIDGLLLNRALPLETKAREPEMLYYQQTPARIIFELVEKAHLTREDVFYDLGSGLGQVQIVANLLSGVTARGIEFEPAYCNYARVCAADLNLDCVEFINADARTADFSDGTVFFMYTPFEGGILQEVLKKLWGESQKRQIRLFTYGPCTLPVSRQGWLKCSDSNGVHINRLGAFSSF